MAKITLKSGEGFLHLTKSKNYVALKTKEDLSTNEQDFVETEIIKDLGGFDVVRLAQVDHENMDQRLDEVRKRKEVEVGTHVYFADGGTKPIVASGEIFIQFEAGVSLEEQKMVLDEYHLDKMDQRDKETVLAKVTKLSPNPFKVGRALQALSMVKIAEPDFDIPLDEYGFSMPLDDLVAHEWHLQNKGRIPDSPIRIKSGADAKVVDAWKRLGNTGSSKIKVAVIDNGFDTGHPDLKNKIINPFNLKTESAWLPQSSSDTGHGTSCASVAIAASNGTGIIGAAPNAKFIPVHGTSFEDSKTEKMFDYCVKKGADIISCSWGTVENNHKLSYRKKRAIADAAKKGRNGKGTIIVYAAGNEGVNYLNHYAAHPDVIAVGASTSQDKHAYYSNTGLELSVVAPSSGDYYDDEWPVMVARAWWDKGNASQSGNYKFWADGKSRGEKYHHFGGTSSAAPLVAGICALMLSANPALTAKEVKQILQSTADKIGKSWEYSNGYSKKYGYGRVNADRAVAEALRRKDSVAAPVQVKSTVSKGKGLFRFSVEKQTPSGWGVQTAAYKEYGNVLVAVEKFQKQYGVPILVNISELKGKTVYKVILGVFSSKSEAQKLERKMKANGEGTYVRTLASLVK